MDFGGVIREACQECDSESDVDSCDNVDVDNGA